MNQLKITIITVTYNSEKTVRETFESVRLQNYTNLEYLIIDGGSTDSTLKIASEYEDIITTIISEPDEGISDAMNKGIRLATGDLIGIIHSDDALTEDALVHLAEIWDEDSDVYYGDVIMMSADWIPMHILHPSKNMSDMNYGFCINHPSTFVTKAAYDKYGIFDTKLRCCMDYDLFLRFYKMGASFKYVPHSLAKYRMGGTNQKYRRQTIDESCLVTIRYGGNRVKANLIKYKKICLDYIRPMANKLGIHNRRVQKI